MSVAADPDLFRGILLGLLADVPLGAPRVSGAPVTGEERLLIDGALVAAADGRKFPVASPFTGEQVGVVADAGPAEMDGAIGAAARAFAQSGWERDHALRARCLRQLQAALRDEVETLRRDLVAEIGCAVRMTYGDQLDRPIEKLGFYADLAEGYDYEPRLHGGDGPGGVWLAREPVGVVGAITPWNLPGRARPRKGRGGARGGLHGRAQAVAALAVGRDPPGAARRRANRDAARRAQRGHLLLERGRRDAHDRSARRRRGVHRLHRHRPGGDGGGRGDGEARAARARRQVGQRHPRRRRPRGHRPARRGLRLLQRGAELHPPVAPARAAAAPRPLRRARCRGPPCRPARRPGRSGCLHGPARQRRAGRASHAATSRRGVPTGRRWSPAARPSRASVPAGCSARRCSRASIRERAWPRRRSSGRCSRSSRTTTMRRRWRSRTARSTGSPATSGAATPTARSASPGSSACGMVGVNGGSFIGADIPFGGCRQSGIEPRVGRRGLRGVPRAQEHRRRGVLMVVDAHCHLFPPAWRAHGHMPPDMFEPQALIERHEAAGIGTAVVSDPHIWYGALDPSEIERTREYNDFAAELARSHPGRLAALGDGDALAWRRAPPRGRAGRDGARAQRPRAAHERRRPLPRRGAGRVLGARHRPRRARSSSIPGGTVVGQELMDMYRLGEVCGRPLDTTVTLARFILTGTFERHPGLRLLCAHAGGAICTIADRLDFGHELRALRTARPLGRGGAARAAVGARRAALPRHRRLRHGRPPLPLERVGPRQLLYGSDRPPVPLDHERTIGYVRALGLPAADEAAVLGRQRAGALPDSHERDGGSSPTSTAAVRARPQRRRDRRGRRPAVDARRRGARRGPDGHPPRLRARRLRRLQRPPRRRARARLPGAGGAGRGADGRHGRGPRRGRRAAPRAAGVPRRAGAAVRLLHRRASSSSPPGCARRSRMPATSACATCCPRTSAAAPATGRSSRAVQGRAVKAPPFAYARAESVEDALALLAEAGDDAKLLAGGQSLMPLLALPARAADSPRRHRPARGARRRRGRG